jgi:hypothetical protein
MTRTVIVGDVHGCREELDLLLDHVGLDAGDQLIFVGDLVVRGPDPCGVIDLAMKLGARSVRGNHEDRLLRYHGSQGRMMVGALTRITAHALKRRHWEYLASLPLWLDLASHNVRIVHAGVVPGVAIEQQNPRTLMYVRTLDAGGMPHEQREEYRGRVLWGHRYEGAWHVAFGHNARQEPQIHRQATGLDTACVYGNKLTAMVLRAGEHPPPPSERHEVMVSVPARRAYVTHA